MTKKQAKEALEILWNLKTSGVDDPKFYFIEYGLMLLTKKKYFKKKEILKFEDIIFNYYNVTTEEVKSDRKFKNYVEARYMMWSFLKKHYLTRALFVDLPLS